MRVPLVDVVTWLALHFHEDDYLVVKLDVEGAEFPIINALLDRGLSGLVDVLVLECHGFLGDCGALFDRLHAEAPHCRLLTEGKDQPGWDSLSTPELYYPVDPRG